MGKEKVKETSDDLDENLGYRQQNKIPTTQEGQIPYIPPDEIEWIIRQLDAGKAPKIPKAIPTPELPMRGTASLSDMLRADQGPQLRTSSDYLRAPSRLGYQRLATEGGVRKPTQEEEWRWWTTDILQKALGVRENPSSMGQVFQDMFINNFPSAKLAAITGAAPEVVRGYRAYRSGVAPKVGEFRGAASRYPGAFDEMTEQQMSEYVKNMLGGPLFHGPGNTNPEKVARDIMQGGFSTANVGSAGGFKLGEPLGISLSANPRIAASFGDPFLRTYANVDPKNILAAFSEEAIPVFSTAYQRALQKGVPRTMLRDQDLSALRDMGYTGTASDFIPARDIVAAYLAGAKRRGYDPRSQAALMKEVSESMGGNMKKFIGDALSQDLQRQGVQGVVYSPRRYSEAELRVLDPSKVVPLEIRRTMDANDLGPSMKTIAGVMGKLGMQPDDIDQMFQDMRRAATMGGPSVQKVAQQYQSQIQMIDQILGQQGQDKTAWTVANRWLGTRNALSYKMQGQYLPNKYGTKKSELLNNMEMMFPDPGDIMNQGGGKPIVSLSDIYKNIPLKQVLGREP